MQKNNIKRHRPTISQNKPKRISGLPHILIGIVLLAAGIGLLVLTFIIGFSVGILIMYAPIVVLAIVGIWALADGLQIALFRKESKPIKYILTAIIAASSISVFWIILTHTVSNKQVDYHVVLYDDNGGSCTIDEDSSNSFSGYIPNCTLDLNADSITIKVTDDETGNPLSGIIVTMTWKYEDPTGGSSTTVFSSSLRDEDFTDSLGIAVCNKQESYIPSSFQYTTIEMIDSQYDLLYLDVAISDLKGNNRIHFKLM